LDGVLRAIHDAWIADARRFLEPALDPDADFWTRWGTVRYLSDTFLERLRQERALVHELRPFLPPDAAERLERGSELLVRSRLELDRIGRRRGTAAEVAAGTRQLLTQLGVWCAEIELAATGVAREVLPAEGATLLAQLEAALPIPE
jgi:hypothetical protein